jgi:hypothetical protein
VHKYIVCYLIAVTETAEQWIARSAVQWPAPCSLYGADIHQFRLDLIFGPNSWRKVCLIPPANRFENYCVL